jgi:hypothetical protein
MDGRNRPAEYCAELFFVEIRSTGQKTYNLCVQKPPPGVTRLPESALPRVCTWLGAIAVQNQMFLRTENSVAEWAPKRAKSLKSNDSLRMTAIVKPHTAIPGHLLQVLCY